MALNIGKPVTVRNDLLKITKSIATSLNPRPYAAFYSSVGRLWAQEYLGGEFVQTIADIALPAGMSASPFADWHILSTTPLIVCYKQNNRFLIWNVTANTKGPAIIHNFSFVIAGGGRDGFVYFVENDNSTYFTLFKIGTNSVETRISPASPGDELSSPLIGFSYDYGLWNGLSFYIPTNGGGNINGNGYVEVNSVGSVFNVSQDFLPTLPDDWVLFEGGRGDKIPGQNKSLGIDANLPDRHCVTLLSPPSVELYSPGDMDGESPYFTDPSPDGITALIYSGSKVSQISLNGNNPPEWQDMNGPNSIDAIFCLD